MTRHSLVLAALCLAACSSAGHYPALAEGEQQAFMGCWRQQGRGLCGPHSLEHMDCRRAYQANYAERPADERAAYLLELGCGPTAPEIEAETAGSEVPVADDAAAGELASGSEAPAARDPADHEGPVNPGEEAEAALRERLRGQWDRMSEEQRRCHLERELAGRPARYGDGACESLQ